MFRLNGSWDGAAEAGTGAGRHGEFLRGGYGE
jgi:hypothetical protein